MKSVAVIDYGAGNLFSLIKALKFLGVSPVLAQTPQELAAADGLILPGVGAFPAGMEALDSLGLVDAIRRAAESQKKILGICLGAQLLMDDGYEFRHVEGLGCVPGRVVKFPALAAGYRVPNINWNPVVFPSKSGLDHWEGTPLAQTEPGSQFYFVHSFICEPTNHEDILAQTEYGGFTFCSVYRRGNVFGSQFHPEKSGNIGLRFLQSFLDLI